MWTQALLRCPAGLNGARPLDPLRNGLGAGPTEECLGSVKWYNVEKGFGFVAQDRGGKDVFVHATTLDKSGLSELPEGRRVRMQISQGQKGPEARSIELMDSNGQLRPHCTYSVDREPANSRMQL